MGEDKEEGGLEGRGVFSVVLDLAPEILSRIIERMDFVDPERFPVKAVKTKGKAD
jgi:hypothetical protein